MHYIQMKAFWRKGDFLRVTYVEEGNEKQGTGRGLKCRNETYENKLDHIKGGR